VYVTAWVSINGSPRAQLVDPTVDLAAETSSLTPRAWVLDPPWGAGGERGYVSEPDGPSTRSARRRSIFVASSGSTPRSESIARFDRTGESSPE
jgi:hypothetical protein